MTAPDESSSQRRVIYTERIGNVKYTYYDDGIVKITRYKVRRKVYWGRIFSALLVLVLLIFGFVQLFKTIVKAVKSDKTDIPANSSMSGFDFDSKPDTDNISKADESDKDVNESSNAESSQVKYENMNLRVCIDPGHGDVDTGSISYDGITEASQNLEIAELVRDRLEDCGVSVTMTRDGDEMVSLGERCTIANEAGCDFFVSLHRNNVTDDYADDSGVEIWVNSNAPEYDCALAENILAELGTAGISRDLGVKYGYRGLPDNNYLTNIDTVMPSCIVELGFVNSEQDNELLLANKDKYAEAISRAVIKTAIDLGVIGEDGGRLLTGQLISEGKNKVYIPEAQ